ncbi:MAG: TonB-dependent receptor [Gammaproteobacteria bacterium]|nr:TonB-dependent receptor [Gammaproteobacteria bacterium]
MSTNSSHQQFSRKSVAVAVSAACAGVPAAQGQEVGRLEEIVVTATKREVSIQDVPMSIAAFSNDDIVREGFKQLEDYALRIPALSFGTRHPGGSNVVMRGCAVSGIAFSDNPTTSIYLDEQPITVAGFNPDPRLVDIARIEALSGPQGSLFGDASQCGTLRIITNKPDPSEFDAWVDLGVNSVSHGDTGYDVAAMINIPLVENKAALRLVGFQAEEAGYIDNVLGNSPVGPGEGPPAGDGTPDDPFYPPGGVGTFDNSEFVEDDVNTATTSGVRAALRWQPTEEWTVDIGAIYQKREEDGFGDTDLDEVFYRNESLGQWEQLRFEEEDFEDEWYQLALTLEGKIGNADVVLAASYMDRETDFRADGTSYLSGWQERYTPKWTDAADPYDCFSKAIDPCYAIYDYSPSQDPRAQVFNPDQTERTSFELRVATPSDSDSRWSGIIGAFYNKTEGYSHFASNVKDLPDSGIQYFPVDDGAGGFEPYYFGGAHFYLNYVRWYYNCGSDPDLYAYECTYRADPSVNWWTGVYNDTLKQVAIFGELGFDIGDNFNITVGGRWYDIDIDRRLQQATLIDGLTDYRTLARPANCAEVRGTGTWTDYAGQPGVDKDYKIADRCYQDTTSSSSESGFVPKFTATYNIDDNKLIYGTYSEGFRRGGANAAKRRSVFGRPPLNEFQSDLVKNTEIGFKSTLADGKVQFNVTAYRMVWEDMQIEAEDPTPNLFTLGIVNFPEAEITGLEAFLHWQPADSWDVMANLGINNAELSKSGAVEVAGTEIERSAEKGTKLPLTPDMKASLNIEKHFNGRLWGAEPTFGLGIAHTGDSVSSLSGIQSVEFDQPVRTQDAYTLVNLRFGLEGDDWNATLYINNATDEYAEEFFNDRWAQTRLSVNRPRTIGLGFRKNFR